MSVALKELLSALDDLLEPGAFRDYCPNGLQVQGVDKVSVVATAVTASQNMVDQAVEAGADVLLVHHGYFWKNESQVITGMKYNRLASLIKHDINLVAYHLPLDVHPEYGNNVVLGNKLGWQVTGGLEAGNPRSIGLVGRPSKETNLAGVAETIRQVLGRSPLVIGDDTRPVRKVAWCTGAAQGMIEQAAEAGCDLFVSGEISENTVHAARELDIAYISAGHHATERYGVLALGEWLKETFGVEHVALDEENPV